MRECEGNGRAWIGEEEGKKAGKNGGVCTGKRPEKKELTKGIDDYDIGDRYARRET
jgi:hypothetical protein